MFIHFDGRDLREFLDNSYYIDNLLLYEFSSNSVCTAIFTPYDTCWPEIAIADMTMQGAA